jgi:hypothetical protein
VRPPRPVTCYRHRPPAGLDAAIVVVDASRVFYVTARDGERTAWLAGPFASHGRAIGLIDATRDLAEQVDARAVWYAFGTASLPADLGDLPTGTLNARLNVTPDPTKAS